MDCTLFDVYELVGVDMSLSLPKNVLNVLASLLPYLILYFLLSGWYQTSVDYTTAIKLPLLLLLSMIYGHFTRLLFTVGPLVHWDLNEYKCAKLLP